MLRCTERRLTFRYGLTPLHYAAMRGNMEALQQLLVFPVTDLEVGDEQDVSPLHLACTYGHLESVRSGDTPSH